MKLSLIAGLTVALVSGSSRASAKMSEVPGLVSASASAAAAVVADKDTITSPTSETINEEDDEAVHVALRGTNTKKDTKHVKKAPRKKPMGTRKKWGPKTENSAAAVVADKDTIASPTSETINEEDDEAVHVALRGTNTKKDTKHVKKAPRKKPMGTRKKWGPKTENSADVEEESITIKG